MSAAVVDMNLGYLKMENEKNKQTEEVDCKPLTDEQFKEYHEKDARTKKVLRFFKAIWEAINFFSLRGSSEKPHTIRNI